MVTEQDKQAILNGALAQVRDGRKCKFIGEVSGVIHVYKFAYFNDEDKIEHILDLDRNLERFSGEETRFDIVGLWEDEPKTQMGLKLSNALYEKGGVTYREVYIGCCPVHVFGTDVFAKVHGVLLYDGENIFAVPSYIFETFKKLGN